MRGFYVKKHAEKQHAPDAVHLWAMWVVRRFDFGVVLAVHCDPFPGDHAGGKPQPEAEKMTYHRMQIERAVRLVTMQIDCDGNDGDVGEYQCD